MNLMLYSSAVLFTLLVCFFGTLFNFASAKYISTTNATISAIPPLAVTQVGSNVVFNCSVSHMPRSATIRWYRDRDHLSEKGTRLLNDGTLQLNLSSVQLADAQPGFYTCCLVLQDYPDSCSDIQAHVRLQVGYPPAPVRNLTCFSHNIHIGICTWNNPETDSIIETSHTLQRRLNTGNSDLEWATIQCRNNPADTTADNPADTTADNTCVLHSKDNLGDDKRYSYQIVSRNVLGEVTTIMTNPTDFNVHHDAVPYPPSSITVESRSSDSIHAFWEHSEGFNTYDLSYKLRYNTNFNVKWIEKEVPWHQVGFDIVDFDIVDLHPPYAHVCVQLAAQQTSQLTIWGDWSENQCVQLLEEKPSTNPVVAKPHVSRNSDDDDNLKDVSLSWEPLPKDKQNGKILGYNISVIGHLDSFTEYSHTYTVQENVTKISIPGLNRTYEYIFHIVAYNSAGASPVANATVKANPYIPDTTAAAKQDTTTGKMDLVSILVPIAFTLLVLLCLTLYYSWKKLNRKTPDILISSNIGNVAVNTTFRTGEPEIFDEVKVTRSQLIVTMEGVDDNFPRTHIVNPHYPRHWFQEDMPLLEGRDEGREQINILQSAATRLLPEASSEQYSPRSIGSGGSYWPYKRLTPQGLSPIDKHSPGNQWDEDEDKEQAADNRADNDSRGSSTIDVYVKQSAIPGTPRMDTHSTSSLPDLSRHHLAVPPSQISDSSRASSQESDIDSYVQQSQLGATISKKNCEKLVVAMDEGKVGKGGQTHSSAEDNSEISYKRMTPQGLSPIDKHSPGNQWDKDEEKEQHADDRANDSRGSSTIASYVKQSAIPGSPRINAYSRSSLQDLSRRHLAPSGINDSSRASSQDSDIDSYVKQGQLGVIQSPNSSEAEQIPMANYVQSGARSKDVHVDSCINNDRSQSSNETPSTPIANYVQSGMQPVSLNSDSPTDSTQSDDEQSQISDESESNSIANYVQSGKQPEDLPTESSICSSQNPVSDYVTQSNISREFESGSDSTSLPNTQVPKIIESEACCTEDAPMYDQPSVGQLDDEFAASTVSQISELSGGSRTDLNSSPTGSEISAMESGYGSLTYNTRIDNSYQIEPDDIVLTIGMSDTSASDESVFADSTADADPRSQVFPHSDEDFRIESDSASNNNNTPESNGYVPHNAVGRRTSKLAALQSNCPSNCNSGYVPHGNHIPSRTVQLNLLPNMTGSRRGSDDGYSSSHGNGTPPDTPNMPNSMELSQNILEQGRIEMSDLSAQPSQRIHSGYVSHSVV